MDSTGSATSLSLNSTEQQIAAGSTPSKAHPPQQVAKPSRLANKPRPAPLQKRSSLTSVADRRKALAKMARGSTGKVRSSTPQAKVRWCSLLFVPRVVCASFVPNALTLYYCAQATQSWRPPRRLSRHASPLSRFGPRPASTRHLMARSQRSRKAAIRRSHTPKSRLSGKQKGWRCGARLAREIESDVRVQRALGARNGRCPFRSLAGKPPCRVWGAVPRRTAQTHRSTRPSGRCHWTVHGR